MTLLILGLLLWWIFHSLPLAAKSRRDALALRLGEKAWKGLFALISVLSIVLMVIGYQRAEFVHIWFPPAWTMHLTDLLMLFVVILFGAANAPTNIRRHVRHPMFAGLILWAVSHLLANGDRASLVLFGGMGLWGVAAWIMANARDGAWVRKPKVEKLGPQIGFLVGCVLIYLVIGFVHGLVGPSPFQK